MRGDQSTGASYNELIRAGRKIDSSSFVQQVRLAILSDAATQQMAALLKAQFSLDGIGATIFEGAFDAMEIETFDAKSALYAFQPDVIVIANSVQAFRHNWYRSGENSIVFARSASGRIQAIWAAIRAHSNAAIIQFNLAAPYERLFGNYDFKPAEWSLAAAAVEWNRQVTEAARLQSDVLLCDVDAIAGWVGRRRWFDERLWNIAKTFCAPEAMPQVTRAVTKIVASKMGRGVKCVVVDLDNTLWGGVVGDDGPHGVVISSHGDGEAFWNLQHFLLRLKKRGVLLAAVSKNNFDIALEPFRSNSEMVLKREDFTVFIANWENKADNIRAVAEKINIGLDSLVFLDDNPFERGLVRKRLPEVTTPDLPEDPGDYVKALCELNLFETTSFSNEDLLRADLYNEEAGRRELQSSFTNIDDYLQSLEMTIELERFTPKHIGRISQLIQRSNQFNLTTRRHKETDCERMMNDSSNWLPLYASLRDRFGDYGLISVAILRLAKGEIEITDWLMSCRALTRGVEEHIMNHVVDVARSKGARRIVGEYIPTAKNGMVREFFARFGFTMESDEAGRTRWTLDPGVYTPRKTWIAPASEMAWTASQ
jgi:FkbH-like protein